MARRLDDIRDPAASAAADDGALVVLGERDVDALSALSAACFPSPWGESLWRAELAREMASVWGVRSRRGELLAFLDFWLVRDEVHVLNLATRPDARRRGLASRLLVALLAHAEAARARYVTLEVRRGNRGAQRLYRAFGFEAYGLRPSYYDDGEDALVMLRPTRPRAAP